VTGTSLAAISRHAGAQIETDNDPDTLWEGGQPWCQ